MVVTEALKRMVLLHLVLNWGTAILQEPINAEDYCRHKASSRSIRI